MQIEALNERWRVVHTQLQWVLQRHQGGRWRDHSFCCTRSGLLRCIREHCGEADIAGITRLPEWHPDRAAAAVEAPARVAIAEELFPAPLPASMPALLPEGSYETDSPLEYYADGYPKLPACLDRRPKPSLAEAA